MNRLSSRSTRAPIGIAKKSHGSITIAPIAEIRTVLSVNVMAKRGTAAPKTPSARFETILAAHIRLNAGPMSKTLSDGNQIQLRALLAAHLSVLRTPELL
jgi:hypothetical protein